MDEQGRELDCIISTVLIITHEFLQASREDGPGECQPGGGIWPIHQRWAKGIRTCQGSLQMLSMIGVFHPAFVSAHEPQISHEEPFAPQEDLSEEQKVKADGLYQYAKNAGMTVSRDEIAEQISSGQLSDELQSLWVEKSAQQEAVSRLNAAASRGDMKELQVCPANP